LDQKTNSVIALAPGPERLALRNEELDWREEDPQLRTQILFVWRVILKWRWLILAIAIAGLLVGLVVTLLTTPVYRGTAAVQIDREAPKIVKAEGVQPQESYQDAEFFGTQYGLLKSRTLAQRVIRKLNLVDDPEFAPQSIHGEAKRFDKATDKFMKNLHVDPIRLSSLVDVSFDSTDPVLAARVTNEITQNFIQTNLERRYEASSYARAFLDARIGQVREKLEDSEKELAAYAARQQIINVGSNGAATKSDPGGGAVQSLTATDLDSMNRALADAQQARLLAEQRWRQARSTNGLGLPELQQSLTLQALQESRAALAADYQDKLKRFKPEYADMVQLHARIAETDHQIAAVSDSIKESLRAQYQITLNNENALAAKVAGLKGAFLNLQNRSIRYNIIQRDVDTSRTFYEGLLEREKEVAVAGVGSNNVSVIDAATVPSKPVKPRVAINLAVAGGVGLLLGFALAFGLEQLDQSIKTSDDVESKLGLPVLGAIPMIKDDVAPFEALADPRSALSEAYNSARTALQLSTADGVPASLFVTSTQPAEGKSTTSIALAKSLAALGHRVLLVDADLRNPSLHRSFHVPNQSGLSSLLAGQSSLGVEVRPTGIADLTLLPAGALPPNPGELLAGRRLMTTLAEALTQYDHIVIDGPPIMGLADAPLLASVADGTVLVIEAGETGGQLAKTALKRINRGGVHILGALLTKFDFGGSFGGDYAYSYHYQYAAHYSPESAPNGRLTLISNSIGKLFRRS
jgi:capsular exopolysaccharide synthesis family protein